jgi:hypothetical protein
MAVDITINETIDLVDITVNPNVIEVNVTRTSGGGAGIPTLQQVLNNNHDLVDGNFFAGTGAGDDNSNTSVIGIGTDAALVNSGQYVIALGYSAGINNSGDGVNALGANSLFVNFGDNINAFGENAASYNSGNNVNAFGYQAGIVTSEVGNTFDNVNLFGQNATADENGQTVLSKDGTIMARISTTDLTESRKYTLQDADGTLAFLSDITGGGGVPYTGATQDVDLGEFGLLTGNIEFDTTPTNIPTTAGSMVWNDTDGTVDLKLKGGNVTLQIGQENVLRVVNKTATNVNLLEANYQAVRVTGAQGQRLKVDLAQATTDALSAETIGLVTETINNNQEGFITTGGLIRNVNTTGSLQSETWADGDILYLSPTVAGQLTKVKPTAPNHLIIVGYVVSAHATQGSIFVKVDNGYELNELHNVKITSETNGQALTYTSATDIWENKTIIEDSITDGVTTVAPSQNAVFDLFQFTRRLITNSTGSVTGTTAETILTSLTIPANTLDSKCFIWSTMDFFKSSAGLVTVRLYINTTNSLSGATLIGFTQILSNRNLSFNRKLYLNGTTLDFLSSNTGASQVSNEFIEAIVGASTTLTVNPANDIFLIYTTQNDAVGTTGTNKIATVQKLKLN